MKRTLTFLVSLCLVCSAFAGFKVKLVKPKKPEQYQARVTAGDVTYAADLVIEAKDQKSFFYKELTPAHVMAIRLAVFNQGRNDVAVPIDRLQLTDPSGKEVALVAPEAVAEAVLQGLVVNAKTREQPSGQIVLGRRDPRLDPTDPRYDPTTNPNDPAGRRIPGGSGPWGRPGVDVVLNPGGGTGATDLSQFEKELVEKDFIDKAHSVEPVLPSSGRDKFLYFSITEKPAGVKGFTLKLPPAKGITQEVILKF